MTTLSISNIAWNTADDAEAARILAALDVHHIDIAPGKYFPNPETASDTDIRAVRKIWQQRGFSLAGFQSLLFGTQGLNVFASPDVQEKMLTHLTHICRIAAGLGVHRLVFGSPRNRDRKGLSDAQTEEMAQDFFTRLGNIAQIHDVVFCLEPNPEAYGANFLTNTRDACNFVSALNHPAIRLQLDTGAMFMNNESCDILQTVREWTGHVHISEPNLAALGQSGVSHELTGNAFRKAFGTFDSISAGTVNHCEPLSFVTIEMLVQDKGPGLLEKALVQAVQLVRRHYL